MRTKDMHRLELRKIRFDGRMFRRIIRIGLPAGLQSVMYTSSNILIQSSVNALGTDTVAAWTAYSKIDSLFWMIVNAFGISITTFVGQNYGAGQLKRCRKVLILSIIEDAIATAAAIILVLLSGRVLLSVFNNDPQVIKIGYTRLVMIFSAYALREYVGLSPRIRNFTSARDTHGNRCLRNKNILDIHYLSAAQKFHGDHGGLSRQPFDNCCAHLYRIDNMPTVT